MAGQSHDRIISPNKNKKIAAQVFHRIKELFKTTEIKMQQKFLIKLEACNNGLFESK